MQRKNLKLMAVSAVVIVICLLFSWAYMDGGQVEQMRHAEVGDYMVLDCVDSSEDGEVEYILTATVVGEDEAWNQTVQWVYDDGGLYYTKSEGNFFTDVMGEIVGTETVDSPYFGEIECNIYLQSDGSLVWNPIGSNAFVMDSYEENGVTTTRMLVDTSMCGDVPEFGHSVEEDTVEVGDYYAYEVCVYDDNGELTDRFPNVLMVHSVEGDQVICGWIDGEDRYTVSMSEFLDHTSFDVSEGSGLYLIDNRTYGERLCTMITAGSDEYLVGVDDGVCYSYTQYFDGYSMTFDLVYSPLVAGDQEPTEYRQDMQVGDAYSLLLLDRMDGRWTVHIETNVVKEVLGDTCIVDVYYDGTFSHTDEIQMNVDREDPDPTATMPISTPRGVQEVNIYIISGVSASTTIYWTDELGVMIAEIVVGMNGDMSTTVLLWSTQYQ